MESIGRFTPEFSAPKSDAKIIFVYGCEGHLPENEWFKNYTLPMYGKDSEEDDQKCHGFVFNTIVSPYDYFPHVYQGSLQLNSSVPPTQVIEQFNALYDGEAKIFAYIQNVYTSHYVSGSFLYGYEIDQIDEDDIDKLIKLEEKLTVKGLTFQPSAHNQGKRFFIGKEEENVGGYEANEFAEDNALKLSRKYDVSESNTVMEDEILTFLSDNNIKCRLSLLPMLIFVQTMCYDCT